MICHSRPLIAPHSNEYEHDFGGCNIALQITLKVLSWKMFIYKWHMEIVKHKSLGMFEIQLVIGENNPPPPQWPLLLTWFNFNPSMDK